MRTFAEKVNACGVDGIRNSFSKVVALGPHPSTFTSNVQKLNQKKCRYTDVPCLDHSRVILKPWPEGNGDFIHANWLTDEILDNKFICAQGPLENTCGDFWRMIWQEDVQLIIMLCRTCEEDRAKCAQYWPSQMRTKDPDVQCTAIKLTYRNKDKQVVHYQWISWPDKFVPKQLTVPFTLLSSARSRQKPTVIHCSAGIGRTGTLIVLELVAKVVQNEEQFLYIHYLTLQRFINKGIISDKLVSNFCRNYEHFYYARTHEVQIPLPVFVKKKSLSSRSKAKKRLSKKARGNGQQSEEDTIDRLNQTVQSPQTQDLLRNYQAAQQALLASYQQAQNALQQTYAKTRKNQQIQKATKEKQMQDQQLQELLQKMAKDQQQLVERSRVEATKSLTAPAENAERNALVCEVVLKTATSPVSEEDEKVDETGRSAQYLFMQPVYANKFCEPKAESNEVNALDLLPEKYFNSEVDDGAEYVKCPPPVKKDDKSQPK